MPILGLKVKKMIQEETETNLKGLVDAGLYESEEKAICRME
jgi:hypothetical protein